MSGVEYQITDYKSAFNCFVERFLRDRKSIFRLEERKSILNTETINYLINNFVKNGMGGNADFIDKIKYQLVEIPENKQYLDDALEVLAHALWLWRLVPVNAKMDSTKSSIKEMLNLNGTGHNINDDNPFFNKLEGIASVGTYYNTNKPFEIAYILQLFKYVIEDMEETEIKNKIVYFCSKEREGIIEGPNNLIKDKSGKLIVKASNAKNGSTSNKPASIRNALLFFSKPDKYEAILSNTHKEKIVEAFKDLIEDKNEINFLPEIDWKINAIKKEIGDDYYNGIHFFYEKDIIKLWDGDSIENNKNIIYYGVPGTGKTHDVLKEVRNLTDSEKYFKLVQFHPSYSYEDFIDGVKPIGNKGDSLQLGLVNGVFKEMCIDAYKEIKRNKDNPQNVKKFYFIADEINRAELSRVFGELLLCIEEDKRLRFENGELKGELIKTQNSNLWSDEHAVVKNENGLYFGVPENIYFIGTMNDVDRSIESFDLALRRRFVWIKKETKYTVIKDELKKTVEDKSINTFVNSCKRLNDEIKKTIGSNYQLGHSYFLKITPLGKTIPDISKRILFQNELKPILYEYLRSVIDENNIAAHLKTFEDKFIPIKKKEKNDSNS